MTADPKPVARVKATPAEWKELMQVFKNQCCVACGLAFQDLHHVAFKKADRGDDIQENLAPMCHSCHERFHCHGPGWERIAGAVRQYVLIDYNRRRYAEEKLGERFNRRYPVLANTDTQFLEDFQTLHLSDRAEVRPWTPEEAA